MVGGDGGLARAPPPPPLESEKKEDIRENFNIFHLYFTNEIRGGSATMQHGREWADRRVFMVGGREERGPCPLEIKKKDAVRGNFNLFRYLFTYFIYIQYLYSALFIN